MEECIQIILGLPLWLPAMEWHNFLDPTTAHRAKRAFSREGKAGREGFLGFA
jgi:hypothetical protein